MADVSIRGVTYTGVAKLDLDKSGGGSAIYYDTEDADAVAADILTGKKAYGASGLITGTRQPPSGSISITDNGSVDVTDYATALVNVQGGGGGPTASDAILTVTAPAGSTVTATKGSATLVPTLWTTAADATQECALFVIEQEQFDATAPWTVTATNGTDTISDTVTIDSNKQYDVELTYFVYIVRDGVLDSANFPAVPSSLARGQTSGSYYCFESIGSGGTYNTAVMRFGPIPTFDKVFTRLVFDVHSIYLKSTASGRSAHFGIRDNGSSTSAVGWQVQQTSQTAPVILEMDVSAISLAGQYVGMSFYNTAASGCNCYVSNIYLAR